MDNFCEWHLDDDEMDLWESACGEAWCFMEGDPKLNGMKFCPYCGKTLVQRAIEPEDDDDFAETELSNDELDDEPVI